MRELSPGEVSRYTEVRVADEIVFDRMKSAGGIDYRAALPEVVTINVDGVLIPFASPRLLWKMKVVTGREKDGPHAARILTHVPRRDAEDEVAARFARVGYNRASQCTSAGSRHDLKSPSC